jgi:hypothetical protein
MVHLEMGVFSNAEPKGDGPPDVAAVTENGNRPFIKREGGRSRRSCKESWEQRAGVANRSGPGFDL